MKKCGKLMLLVMVLLTTSACSEDPDFYSLKSADRIENSLVSPLDRLELELATDIKLQKRVSEIKSELNAVLTPNMKALQVIGREILLSRDVNPEDFFNGPDDPRLALVPMVTEILDSINAEMNLDGYYIESVVWVNQSTQQQQIDNGNSIAITQDLQWGRSWSRKLKNAADCFDQSGAMAILGGMTTAMTSTKTAGVVIGSICGVGVPAWAAVAMVGGGYYAFRVGDCQGKAIFSYGIVEKDYLENCRDIVMNTSAFGRQSSSYKSCARALDREMYRIMSEARNRFGDTLIVAATN